MCFNAPWNRSVTSPPTLGLASCRQLALVLMDVRKDHGEERQDGLGVLTEFSLSGCIIVSILFDLFCCWSLRLDNHWVEFANYAQDFVRGPDSWRLRHLCRPGSKRPVAAQNKGKAGIISLRHAKTISLQWFTWCTKYFWSSRSHEKSRMVLWCTL